MVEKVENDERVEEGKELKAESEKQRGGTNKGLFCKIHIVADLRYNCASADIG